MENMINAENRGLRVAYFDEMKKPGFTYEGNRRRKYIKDNFGLSWATMPDNYWAKLAECNPKTDNWGIIFRATDNVLILDIDLKEGYDEAILQDWIAKLKPWMVEGTYQVRDDDMGIHIFIDCDCDLTVKQNRINFNDGTDSGIDVFLRANGRNVQMGGKYKNYNVDFMDLQFMTIEELRALHLFKKTDERKERNIINIKQDVKYESCVVSKQRFFNYILSWDEINNLHYADMMKLCNACMSYEYLTGDNVLDEFLELHLYDKYDDETYRRLVANWDSDNIGAQKAIWKIREVITGIKTNIGFNDFMYI